MKKSEVYKIAQSAIIRTQWIDATDKLEILRVLMDDEDLAKYVEEQEAKEAAETAAVEV